MNMHSLITAFNESWPFEDDDRDQFVVQDTGSSCRIIIKNSCSWMTRGGGCTICNYSSRNAKAAGEVLLNNGDSIIEVIKSKGIEYPSVQVYMNGSYFADNEIDPYLQVDFLRRLADDCGFTNIKIETRPEYISKAKVERIKDITRADLEIAIGLESVNDKVRINCLNKGFSFAQFIKAVGEIKDICKIKVYLLFKPPFLTEAEAVEDVINSIRVLLQHDISCISITPVTVQSHTLLEFLLQERLYRPPWLWSLIETNSQIKKHFPQLLSGITGLDYFPVPIAYPFNCERCSDKLYMMLRENPRLSWDEISNPCECKHEWEGELLNKSSSIETMIKQAFDLINKNRLRSREIADIVVSRQQDALLRDYAKECPSNKTVIDAVGVRSVPIMVSLSEALFSPLRERRLGERIVATGSCSANVRLDEFHRGVHMSRMINNIEQFCRNHHENLRSDVRCLCDQIVEDQNETSGSVELDLEVLLPARSPRSDKFSNIKISFSAMVSIMRGKIIDDRLGISWPIVNACPCTLELSQALYKNKPFTHMQKGKVEIKTINNLLDVQDLIRLVPESEIPRSFLKREDEIHLVKSAFDPPEFCEDICRRLANKLQLLYHGIGGSIIIDVETEESIHIHSVRAVKQINL